MTKRSANPAEDRLRRLLPILRLPASDAAAHEHARFHKRVELRLGELARMTACTPEQCIGLALYLGSQGWTAFSMDESDLNSSGRPTAKAFHQRMMLSVATYDENGTLRYKTDKQRAHAYTETERKVGIHTVSDDSARVLVANYRRSTLPEQRSDPLLAIFNGDDSKLPADLVLTIRRKHLRSALEAAASRLTVKARQGGL